MLRFRSERVSSEHSLPPKITLKKVRETAVYRLNFGKSPTSAPGHGARWVGAENKVAILVVNMSKDGTGRQNFGRPRSSKVPRGIGFAYRLGQAVRLLAGGS